MFMVFVFVFMPTTPQPGLVWAGVGPWLGPVTVTVNGLRGKFLQ